MTRSSYFHCDRVWLHLHMTIMRRSGNVPFKNLDLNITIWYPNDQLRSWPAVVSSRPEPSWSRLVPCRGRIRWTDHTPTKRRHLCQVIYDMSSMSANVSRSSCTNGSVLQQSISDCPRLDPETHQRGIETEARFPGRPVDSSTRAGLGIKLRKRPHP